MRYIPGGAPGSAGQQQRNVVVPAVGGRPRIGNRRQGRQEEQYLLEQEEQDRQQDQQQRDRDRQQQYQYQYHHQQQHQHHQQQQAAAAAQTLTPHPSEYRQQPKDDHYEQGCNSDDEYDNHHQEGRRQKPRKRFMRDNDAFANTLKEDKGWEIIPMEEDGACLFRAVAHHVFGDQGMHDVVRRQCLDYMENNRDHFSEFIAEDFDHYIRRKRDPRCYGNHAEIQAVSEMFNRNVEIYDGDTVPVNTFQAEGSTEAPIRLSYHNGIHYNAVVDPNHPTFGVGLGFSDLRPGEADRNLMEEAIRVSEQELIEKQIMEESRAEMERKEMEEAIESAILAQSLSEYMSGQT